MRDVPRRACYRLQLGPDLPFAAAASQVPYLAELGVSHAYLSPHLAAVPGSTHGYDVVDPRRVRDDLGGAADHELLLGELSRHGLGAVVDLVPNHLAAAVPDNPWWTDVLEHGRASRFATWFDVDWRAPADRRAVRVLVPVLADHYGRVLERGELTLERDGARFWVRYGDHRLPLSPESTAGLLRADPEAPLDGPSRPGDDELAFLVRALLRLPGADVAAGLAEPDPIVLARRADDLEVVRTRLAVLLEDPERAAAIDQHVAALAADPDRLHALLEAQHHRLAAWPVADHELDYRRFFDVDALVGVQVEDPEVFAATHALALSWWRSGWIDGLRLDHVDGLRDPAGYLHRLRAEAPEAWLVVEKILEGDEELPDWPVDGTTGYEQAALLTGLLVHPAGAASLARRWVARTAPDAGPETFPAIVAASKAQVVDELLVTELARLTDLLGEVCEVHRRYRDFSRPEQRDALRAVLVTLPVYRTYVGPDGLVRDADRGVVDRTLAAAAEMLRGRTVDLLELLGHVWSADEGFDHPAAVELRLRLQQVGTSVMAKGKEDTALYRYGPVLAAAEVGADPAHPARSLDDLHAHARRAQARHPAGLVTVSTHDTKHSGDVRARLAVLTQPEVGWADAVDRWSTQLARTTDPAHRLDPAFELRILQTLVGAHPLPLDRAQAWATKAAREAKVHTRWADPDEDYERRARRLVARGVDGPWLDEQIAAVADRVRTPGRRNSLVQVLLALTLPGVPDLYQGSELWDLHLVDPDNRRPVDVDLRRSLLAEQVALDARPDELHASLVAALDDPDDPGRPKLHVVRRALAVRAGHGDSFTTCPHEPLVAVGRDADHVIAFRRGDVVVLGARLRPVGPRGEQTPPQATVPLPPGPWRNVLAPGAHRRDELDVAAVLADLPVALLVRDDRR